MPFPARDCRKMHCICIRYGEHRAGRHSHARQRGSRIGNRLHTLVIHIVSASSPLCMKQGLPRILPFIAVSHHLISLRKVVWFSHASEEEPRGRKSSIEIPGISAEHIPLSLSTERCAHPTNAMCNASPMCRLPARKILPEDVAQPRGSIFAPRSTRKSFATCPLQSLGQWPAGRFSAQFTHILCRRSVPRCHPTCPVAGMKSPKRARPRGGSSGAVGSASPAKKTAAWSIEVPPCTKGRGPWIGRRGQ